MIRNRQPTVQEIIAELDNPTGDIGFCRNVRDGRFHTWVSPAELYIDSIGTWLRCDGSHASFALNGQRDFHPVSRNRIKAAVDRWIMRRAMGPTWNDVMNALNDLRKPSDWDKSYEGAIADAMLAITNMKPEMPK